MTLEEAKSECNKRGYKKGIQVDKSVFPYGSEQKIWTLISDNIFMQGNNIVMGNDFVFKNGTWAKIVNECNDYLIY
jgi:hypothetical protein